MRGVAGSVSSLGCQLRCASRLSREMLIDSSVWVGAAGALLEAALAAELVRLAEELLRRETELFCREPERELKLERHEDNEEVANEEFLRAKLPSPPTNDCSWTSALALRDVSASRC